MGVTRKQQKTDFFQCTGFIAQMQEIADCCTKSLPRILLNLKGVQLSGAVLHK